MTLEQNPFKNNLLCNNPTVTTIKTIYYPTIQQLLQSQFLPFHIGVYNIYKILVTTIYLVVSAYALLDNFFVVSIHIPQMLHVNTEICPMHDNE